MENLNTQKYRKYTECTKMYKMLTIEYLFVIIFSSCLGCVCEFLFRLHFLNCTHKNIKLHKDVSFNVDLIFINLI